MRFFRRLRTYFLTGLIVTAPIGITVWLAWWFVSLFDTWVKPFIPAAYNPDTYLPFTVPGVGLLFAVIGITVIGALAANLVGRTILSLWDSLLNRMPVIRSVYKATKQIFETALKPGNANFQHVGLVEYPRRGVNVVVFVARTMDSGDIGLPPGQTMVSCFMPTTPNPTSGFLFFLPEKEVKILDLTVEEGAKLVISAGLVTPKDKNGDLPDIDDSLVEDLILKKGGARPAKKLSRRQAGGSPRRARKGKAKT